jgi:hypothetical protein
MVELPDENAKKAHSDKNDLKLGSHTGLPSKEFCSIISKPLEQWAFDDLEFYMMDRQGAANENLEK